MNPWFSVQNGCISESLPFKIKKQPFEDPCPNINAQIGSEAKLRYKRGHTEGKRKYLNRSHTLKIIYIYICIITSSEKSNHVFSKEKPYQKNMIYKKNRENQFRGPRRRVYRTRTQRLPSESLPDFLEKGEHQCIVTACGTQNIHIYI